MRITLDPRAADELASQIDYLIDNHALLAAVLKARCDAFFEKFLTQHPRTGKHISEKDIWETWIPGTGLVVWYRFTKNPRYPPRALSYWRTSEMDDTATSHF